MKTGRFPIIALCALAAAALLGWSFRKALLTASFRLPQEFEAVVAAIEKAGEAEWMVQKAAVIQEGAKGAYVFRLEKLRAKRIGVLPIGSSGERLIIQSRLEPGDLILADPSSAWDGAAVAVTGGIDQASLIRLTLDAAVAAVHQENLNESMRFVSPRYADSLGFDLRLISGLLTRAFKEFARPRIEIIEGPDIVVQGAEAIVKVSISLRASYRGRRSYLLGGPESSNALWMRMERLPGGWKVAEVRGLMPLGFDERAMRLLGAEVGLPLSTHEKEEKKEFCMPCRNKMVERFGTGR